jgi:xylulokinase
MTSRYVLGIDVGTTALKAIALEREKGIVAQTDLPHELFSPHSGWAEEDPERWWATTLEAIRQLLTIIPAQSGYWRFCMVPAMVILMHPGATSPNVQQNDARAITEVEERAAVDLKVSSTLAAPNQQNIDTKWRWLQRHEPRLWRTLRISVVLTTSSFIV